MRGNDAVGHGGNDDAGHGGHPQCATPRQASITAALVDALRVAKRLLLSLYVHAERLAQRRQRIDGGSNTNVVPERVTLKIDRRVISPKRTRARPPRWSPALHNLLREAPARVRQRMP
ncbi:MAG TPA: peptidase dimerization domain-containing protein [Steroidobacteraceae bacterium]